MPLRGDTFLFIVVSLAGPLAHILGELIYEALAEIFWHAIFEALLEMVLHLVL